MGCNLLSAGRADEKLRISCKMIFDGASDAGFVGFGQAGVAEGSEDALSRLSFRVAESRDELDDRSAFDGFGAEIHAG